MDAALCQAVADKATPENRHQLRPLGFLSINWHAAGLQSPLASASFQQWLHADGSVWAGFHRISDGYLIRFPGLADFEVSQDGQHVGATPVPGISDATLEHLYLNQVLPMALSRQQRLVLHASAVEIDAFGVAFLGPSGRGKSTLAASFATTGFRFITDDGLLLEAEAEGFQIQPSHPSIRLWDDSKLALIPEGAPAAPPVDYSPKSRLLAGPMVSFCNVPRPLKAGYVLGERTDAETVQIQPLGGRDAMIELVRHCFLLDVQERDFLIEHFGYLSALVRRPIFFRLDYPRHYEHLPQVREAVISHARSLNGSVVADTGRPVSQN